MRSFVKHTLNVLLLFLMAACMEYENFDGVVLQSALPTLSTYALSNITTTSASSGGYISSDGGSTVEARGLCWSTSSPPDINDYTTSNGSGLGGFTADMTGLSPGTTYYVRAYATNARGTAYGNLRVFSTEIPTEEFGTLTDIDNNTYYTIEVGTQTWTAENLRTTRFSNGDEISYVADNADWSNYGLSGWPAACSVNNNSANDSEYGRLYNWYAVNDGRKLCPDGWKVPSHEDWVVLSDFLGGEALAGGKLKEAGTTHWLEPNVGATNDIYFSALPAGYRYEDGIFYNLGYQVNFWSSTSWNDEYARMRFIDNDSTWFRANFVGKKSRGYSVRCIKDLSSSIQISTNAVTSITASSAQSGGNISSDGGSVIIARGVCWNSYGGPTTADYKTENGSGTGEFTTVVTGLQPNTTYYIRAYATNANGTTYGNELSFTTLALQFGSLSDIDGNSYKTVIIGDQTWMTGNLKTTRFANGEPIPDISDYTYWGSYASQALPASCNVENNEWNLSVYGKLYNWYAVNDSRKLCPEGWKVPSNDEWISLMDFLGGEELAGGLLKEAGTDHWAYPNTGASDVFDFSALPAGDRQENGYFYSSSYRAYFWTSVEYDLTKAYMVFMDNESSSFNHNYIPAKGDGLSVRCIKDDSGGEDLDTQDEHIW